MRMKTKYIIPKLTSFTAITAMIMLTGGSADAQQKIDPTLEVKREFDGKLMEIQKSRLNTSFADSIANFNLSFDYTIFNKPVRDLYEFSPLPSAQIERSGKPKFPVFQADISAGAPFSPQAKVYYQPNLPTGLSLLVHGSHESWFGKLPSVTVSGNEALTTANKVSAPSWKNDIGTMFGYSWNKGRAGIKLNYENNLVSFHGFTDEDMPAPLDDIRVVAGFPIRNHSKYSNRYMIDSLSRTFNIFKGGLFVKSANASPKAFHYNVELDYSNLSDRGTYMNSYEINPLLSIIVPEKSRKENHIRAKADFGPSFAKDHKFLAGVEFETANSAGTDTLGRSSLTVHPRYLFTRGRWVLEAGIKINKFWEPYDEGFNFFFSGKASIELVKNSLWFYAIADGGNNFRSYAEMLQQNNWVDAEAPIRNTVTPFSGRAGLKGQLADRLSFHVYGGYATYKDQIFYMAYDDTTMFGIRNAFGTSYAKQERFTAGGEISWKSDSFDAGASAEYNHWSRSDSLPSYHYAPLELKMHASYNWRERIFAGIRLSHMSKVPVLEKLSDPVKVSDPGVVYARSFTRLDLHASYVYNKTFAFYLNINNLLNSKGITYMNYAQRGINAQAGVVITL